MNLHQLQNSSCGSSLHTKLLKTNFIWWKIGESCIKGCVLKPLSLDVILGSTWHPAKVSFWCLKKRNSIKIPIFILCFTIKKQVGRTLHQASTLQSNFCVLQIKATDNGRPQKSSTARLHIEWIRRSPPSTVPVLFDEPFYNFTIMENDKVAEIVGLVSLQQSSAPLWFDITGKISLSSVTLFGGWVCWCLFDSRLRHCGLVAWPVWLSPSKSMVTASTAVRSVCCQGKVVTEVGRTFMNWLKIKSNLIESIFTFSEDLLWMSHYYIVLLFVITYINSSIMSVLGRRMS